MSRGGEPQREGHSDIVPELVGSLPVALADAEVEPPERRLAAHVPHGDAVLGGVAEREGHAHVTRHASERELADGLVAGRRLRELRGRVVRLRELRHREQVRAAQGVVALLVAGVGRAHLDRKSTRLNSSHRTISYAVFCLKKKTMHHTFTTLLCDEPCNAYSARL